MRIICSVKRLQSICEQQHGKFPCIGGMVFYDLHGLENIMFTPDLGVTLS